MDDKSERLYRITLESSDGERVFKEIVSVVALSSEQALERAHLLVVWTRRRLASDAAIERDEAERDRAPQ